MAASPPPHADTSQASNGGDHDRAVTEETRKRSRDSSADPGQNAAEAASTQGSESQQRSHSAAGEDDGSDAAGFKPKRKRLSINTSTLQEGTLNGGRFSQPTAGGVLPSNDPYAGSTVTTPVTAGAKGPIVDAYQNALMVKKQQKAIIEARQMKQIRNGGGGPGGSGPATASMPMSPYPMGQNQHQTVPIQPQPQPPQSANAGPATTAGSVTPPSQEPALSTSPPTSAVQPPIRRNSYRNTKNLTIMTPSTEVSTLMLRNQANSAAPPNDGSMPAPAPPLSHASSSSNHPSAVTQQPAPHQPSQPHIFHPPATHSANSSPRHASTQPSKLGPNASRYNPAGPGAAVQAAARANDPPSVASPRSEFPSRELPLPFEPPPRSPHPMFSDRGGGGPKSAVLPRSPSSAYPGANQHFFTRNAAGNAAGAGAGGSSGSLLSQQQSAGSVDGGAMVPRSTFVGAFETLYDVAEEAPRLAATLKDQIRRSSSLLQTLQASGAMIEGLVRGCFREMQAQYGERFGAALADLNRRIQVLEEHSGVGSGGAATSTESVNNGFRGGPPTPYVGGLGVGGKGQPGLAANDAMLRSLLDRIESLEKKAEN
ncbi:hypothetical protein HK101_003841 [Irineochytrium annulatum]|nr:hypothetical protein HK101_003841 [Irineochytrium annulatum]